MKYYIYKITNLIRGKIYFGQTKQNPPIKRFNFHKKVAVGGLAKYPKQFRALHYAMAKYKTDNFTFEVIETCESKNDANEREMFYIALHKTNLVKHGTDFGYNMTDGGDGALGMKHTKATKRQISEALTGKYIGELNWNYGKPLSEEHRSNISAANTGKKHSEETIELFRKINTGEGNPNYGKHHTEEHKQLLSEALTGENNPLYNKPISMETRAKQSIAHQKTVSDYIHPDGVIAKIKAARKNQDMSYRIPIEVKTQVVELFNSGSYTKRQLAEKFDMKVMSIRKIIYVAQKKSRQPKS